MEARELSNELKTLETYEECQILKVKARELSKELKVLETCEAREAFKSV